MASVSQSLLEGTAKKLLSRSPSASSSSCLTCSQLDKEQGKLQRMMKRIRALLSDAEDREIREGSVKLWLAKLRDVADESEDVLDRVEYELQRYQLECDQEEDNRMRQVGDSQPTLADHCSPLHGDASFQQQIITEVMEINGRLDEIYKEGIALNLNEEDEGGPEHSASVSEPSPRVPTSCFVDEQGVLGRDHDKFEVIDKLLLPDDDEHVGVVSIVGAGGLGKTTLAELVYNDDRIEKHFEPRVWVCISESFDVVRLTKEILEAVLGQVQKSDDFSVLQPRLYRELQGKRFLLVLDDAWNEQRAHWEALWVGLSSGAAGSKILITTRSETVSKASRVSESSMYRLGCLSYEDSWSLFEHRAFHGKSSGDYARLVPIGREIVKKCGGMPLVVKALAGLLFYEAEEDRWMDILRSQLWEIPEVEDHILPSLKLSYYHLPSPMKPCFAYCAVFPKNHRFDSEELVRMWIAHGYIRPSPSRCMEDVGSRYFEDLLQRSFFQELRSRDRKVSYFVMHDLIHDLALSIRSGECCQVVDGRLSSNRARHLAFNSRADVARLLSQGPIYNLKWSRTLRVNSNLRNDALFVKALGDIFMRMKHLRVLDLSNVAIKRLPAAVGNLKHLRYLCVSALTSTVLPESVGDLLNLQVLKIRTGLPVNMPKRLKSLVKLRHLVFPTKRLQMMPCGIGKLTQLRTLPLLVVGEGSGVAGIEELMGLNHLQGELKIIVTSLNNWVKWSGGECGGHDDYGERACILKNKQGLDSLALQFGGVVVTPPEIQQQEQEQESLLESLQPHTNIKSIHIWGYGGCRFPKWMGHPSYKRLERIDLLCCLNCRCLPELGQLPSLKCLEVRLMDAVTSVGCEFLEATSFPSLEKLVLSCLWECEGSLLIGTEGGGAFPRLSYLEIYGFPMLKCVRLLHLTTLKELHICECRELTELDVYNEDVSTVCLSRLSLSPSPSEVHPHQVLINGHMQIPNIHIMILQDCPKLHFPPPQRQQQQQHLFPPSLWKFDVSGSPVLSKWATSHRDRLGHLTCLLMDDGTKGKLLSLRNVRDADEACARDYLPSRVATRKVELRWDDDEQPRFCSSPAEAEEVLRRLDPSGCSEELVIQGYQGRSFPYWLEDPAHHGFLGNLVKMTLSGCIHCDRLPSLGQLPSLEQLHISKMPGVRHVGREFCGHGMGTAFRSLQTLQFHEMPQWEAWQEVEDGAFPNLQVLRIYNCPNLSTMELAVPLRLKLELYTLEQEPDTTTNHPLLCPGPSLP